jgi:peptidoglycan/LPS O-acetylase OafA/YrhL
LAVEEQFYLLLPLVIRSLSRTALIRTAFVAVACAPMLRLILYFSGNHYFGPYVLLPCRIDALAAGLLIALGVRSASVVKFVASRRPQLLVALAVLGAGVGMLTFRHQHIILAGFGYTWLAAFYSCLLLLVVVEPGRIAKATFRSAILVQAGTIAYGVYLFHAGANNLIHGLLFGNGAVITHWGETAATVLSLAGVVFIAKLSWRFFEAPLVGLGHRIFRYQPRHPLGLAALPARAGAR